MRRALGGMLMLLLLLTAAGLERVAGADRPSLPRASPSPVAAAELRIDRLYSLRARRRTQALLRFRLLELREAGLERARAVIERRLPIDALFSSPAPGGRPGLAPPG